MAKIYRFETDSKYYGWNPNTPDEYEEFLTDYPTGNGILIKKRGNSKYERHRVFILPCENGFSEVALVSRCIVYAADNAETVRKPFWIGEANA